MRKGWRVHEWSVFYLTHYYMVAWAPLCIMLSTETCPQWGGVPSEPLNEAVYAWELLRSKENHLLGRFSELIRHVNYYIWTCAWLRGIVGSLLRLEKKKSTPGTFFFFRYPLAGSVNSLQVSEIFSARPDPFPTSSRINAGSALHKGTRCMSEITVYISSRLIKFDNNNYPRVPDLNQWAKIYADYGVRDPPASDFYSWPRIIVL